MIVPSLDEFRKLAHDNALVPVYKEILADLETPVTAYLKVARNASYAFLLESVEKADTIGQYSFIGANPSIVFRAKGMEGVILRNGKEEPFSSENTLNELRKHMARYQPAPVPGLPAFHGGAVGYISYDQVRQFEKLPDANPDTLGLPDLYFMITDTLLVFDHVNNKIKIVSNAHVTDHPDAVYNEALRKIHEIEQRLRGPLVVATERLHSAPEEPKIESNFTKGAFCDAVRKAREYICAGDIFQVVLSQRFKRQVGLGPVTLYRALRCINPTPYMYFFNFGDFHVVGSSPEVLVRVEDSLVTVRPIAGTRPRGASEEADIELEQDLLSDAKEIAEHLMLIDLGRNDVGRVSATGSVRLTEKMVIERYSNVMHIVSNVTGQLKAGLSAMDALRAILPAGTLSGAPKVRAMEIIDELEPVKRGVYGGAVGYWAWNGNMDTAIAIRTAVIKDGELHVQAGAGIVADSQPALEWEETLNKRRAMFRAVSLAEQSVE